jgi:phenylalanyl-tRNA synthetase beta chain
MKFSLNWLSEYVDLPEAAQLRQDIEAHSFEVEDLVDSGRSIDEKIISAEVISWEQHPNADRLRIVTLRAGDATIAPVVCGAKNFDSGHKVCLALPGSLVPHDQHDTEGKPFTLGTATIRGIESQGMICSAAELGLSNEHDGILLLPSDTQTGVPVAKIIGDTIIDINVQSTNRADVQQYVGMARDIAAIYGDRALRLPPMYELSAVPSSAVPVDIEDDSICSRYIGVRIEGITVGPSPDWLKKRLASAGMRSINNIVDSTNYVMLEMGQPLHAFDAAAISSIVVRKAHAGETITTLDGEARTLSENILLITNGGKEPLAIAGIMGAQQSGVTENTTSIILEAAKFDPIFTRRASRELGLRTDASSRFEKNISVELAYHAAQRAVALIIELAGGYVAGVTDIQPKPFVPARVELPLERMDRMLGISIDAATAQELLERAGFTCEESNGVLSITAPWWRTDITVSEDAVEEIGRLYGFNKIPEQPLVMPQTLMVRQSLVTVHKRSISQALIAAGFWETVNYSFVPDEIIELFGYDTTKLIEVINPIDATQKYMRPDIAANLLQAAVRNSRKYNRAISYFELGDVFSNQGEVVNVAAVHVGETEPAKTLSTIKSALVTMARELSLPALTFVPYAAEPVTISGPSAATIMAGDMAIGSVGIINPELTEAMGLKDSYAAYFELHDLEAVLTYGTIKSYSMPPRFPSTSFDISFVVDEGVAWSAINKVLQAAVQADDVVIEYAVLDIYRDAEKIGSDKKSMSVRCTVRHTDRTLTEAEANTIRTKIETEVVQKLNAVVR